VNRFSRYQLRTTDVDGARQFYTDLLGSRFWDTGIDAGPLPAAAAARGAPAHWLGHIAVDDVVGTFLRFAEAGATQLGPAPDGADGNGRVVRDPFGAIVALSPTGSMPGQDRVGWHLLSTRDEAQAFRVYSDLFGWTLLETLDLGEQGRHATFTWARSGPAAGSTTDLARRPHVHSQWLFFFRTDDLDASLEVVRESGGLAQRVTETSDGDLVVACDDPQGAAFGLHQRRARGLRERSRTIGR